MADLAPPSGDLDSSKSYTATFKTERGEFEIMLYANDAPLTVENFINLARAEFYDATTFHRVIPGFMVQGGDPEGTGTGGPGYSIDAEFNDTPHDRGIISMARSQDPNSAGSQFFVVVKDSHFLDNQYTAFGRVINGLDVADKIVNVPRDSKDNPDEKVEMISVKILNG